jgi:hypothetical protein
LNRISRANESLCIVVFHAIVGGEGGMFRCRNRRLFLKARDSPSRHCGVVDLTRDLEHPTLIFHELSLNFSLHANVFT